MLQLVMKTIPLTRGLFAKVDDEDYETLAVHRWCAHVSFNGDFRPARVIQKNNKQTTVYMYRLIMNAPRGTYVDHINCDPLDNRKCNLRLCNIHESNLNKRIRKDSTSGYKGVRQKNNKWQAYIKPNIESKRKHLGSFGTIEEAAMAYNKAAKKYHGKFARLNIIKRLGVQ